MEKLKVSVSNGIESKDVQGLFFELGYKFSMVDYATNYNSVQVFDDGSGSLFEDHDGCGNKELTIPQLRDMVVLKRNDVGDATHESDREDCDDLYFKCSNGDLYRWFCGSHWAHAVSYKGILKPVEKKEMKTKEFLNIKAGYVLQVLPEHAGDDADSGLIEVPGGAETLNYFNDEDDIFFLKKDGDKTFYSNETECWSWQDWG